MVPVVDDPKDMKEMAGVEFDSPMPDNWQPDTLPTFDDYLQPIPVLTRLPICRPPSPPTTPEPATPEPASTALSLIGYISLIGLYICVWRRK